eukprot:284816302_6
MSYTHLSRGQITGGLCHVINIDLILDEGVSAYPPKEFRMHFLQQPPQPLKLSVCISKSPGRRPIFRRHLEDTSVHLLRRFSFSLIKSFFISGKRSLWCLSAGERIQRDEAYSSLEESRLRFFGGLSAASLGTSAVTAWDVAAGSLLLIFEVFSGSWTGGKEISPSVSSTTASGTSAGINPRGGVECPPSRDDTGTASWSDPDIRDTGRGERQSITEKQWRVGRDIPDGQKFRRADEAARIRVNASGSSLRRTGTRQCDPAPVS